MPHDQAHDYDEFRDEIMERMSLDANEFQTWLLKHYQHALNPLECLTALVAALYGRLGRNATEYEFEAAEIAALFDATVQNVDKAGIGHGYIQVAIDGSVVGCHVAGRARLSSASAGIRSLPWCEHVSTTASDDAHDLVTEKYEGGI